MVHLRLLPTPPRGDAVTFGYRPESVCLKGIPTPLIEYTLRRTGPGPPDLGDPMIGPHGPGRTMPSQSAGASSVPPPPEEVGHPVQRRWATRRPKEVGPGHLYLSLFYPVGGSLYSPSRLTMTVTSSASSARL